MAIHMRSKANTQMYILSEPETFLSIVTLHSSHGTRVHTHWKLEMRIKINVDAKLRVHADRRLLRFAMSHENIIYNLRFKIFLFIFKSFWYITFHLPSTRRRKRKKNEERKKNSSWYNTFLFIPLYRRKFKGYERTNNPHDDAHQDILFFLEKLVSIRST